MLLLVTNTGPTSRAEGMGLASPCLLSDYQPQEIEKDMAIAEVVFSLPLSPGSRVLCGSLRVYDQESFLDIVDWRGVPTSS